MRESSLFPFGSFCGNLTLLGHRVLAGGLWGCFEATATELEDELKKRDQEKQEDILLVYCFLHKLQRIMSVSSIYVTCFQIHEVFSTLFFFLLDILSREG